MSDSSFGQVAADLHVALGDVPRERVRGKVVCSQGHLMAVLTRDPDSLYTGQEPIQLSDSRAGVIGAWCRTADCPDEGLWEIDLARLRGKLRWRKGTLRLLIREVGTQSAG